MTARKRIRRESAPALLLGAAALVAVSAGLLWVPWDRPDLGERIREIAAYRGIEVEGHGSRYSVRHGLVLEDPEVRMPLPQGEAVLKASELNVRLNIPKFIDDRIWCDQMAVEGARAVLWFRRSSRAVALPDHPEPDQRPLEENRPRCEPEAITLEDAALAIRDGQGKEPVLALEGLDLTLANPKLSPVAKNPLKALIATGEIQAQTLRYGDRTYSGVRGRFEILDGKIEIEELSFESPNGRYRIESGTLDLTAAPPALIDASLSAELPDVRFLLWDLGVALATPLPGELRAGISGPLTRLSTTGDLFFSPERAHLQQIRLVSAANRLALPPKRATDVRGRWKIPFTLVDSRIAIRGARLDTDPLSFVLSGELQPGQAVDLRFDILIPRAEVKDALSRQVLDQLVFPPDRIRVPGRIVGDLSAPRIELRKSDMSPLAFSEVDRYLQRKGAAEATRTLVP